MQLKVEKNTTLSDIKTLFGRLNAAIDQKQFVDLLVPLTITNTYVGVTPLLIQFVVTWTRYENSGKLLLEVEKPEDLSYSIFEKNELIFPIVSLVWNKNGVYNKSGEINLRSVLKAFNSTIFDKIRKTECLKGNKLLLTSFDHLPDNIGQLPCFESNNTFISSETDLLSNLKPGLAQVLSFSTEFKNVFDTVQRDFVDIIWEAMKNTFDWGRTNEQNVPLNPSIRGVLIKFFKKKRQSLLKDYKSHKGLFDYFESSQFKENANEEIGFIEVSIFDSGIGFMANYKNANPSSDSEIDVLRACLIKHKTSSKNLGKTDKGKGLDRILATLNNRGFLRIRTGELDVYRNLISAPYTQIGINDNVKKMALYDWDTGSDSLFTTQEKSGSVLTIIFPLSIQYQNKLIL